MTTKGDIQTKYFVCYVQKSVTNAKVTMEHWHLLVFQHTLFVLYGLKMLQEIKLH